MGSGKLASPKEACRAAVPSASGAGCRVKFKVTVAWGAMVFRVATNRAPILIQESVGYVAHLTAGRKQPGVTLDPGDPVARQGKTLQHRVGIAVEFAGIGVEFHAPGSAELADILREAGFESVDYRQMMLGAAAIHVAHKA